MSEAFSESGQHHKTVDIELDLAPLEEVSVASMKEGRLVPQTIEEKIQAEGLLQHEYVNKGAIFLRLEEARQGVKMPDFRRISVLLPAGIRPAIDETIADLMTLSLYRGTNQAMVREEVERVIRENRFMEIKEEQDRLLNASRARIGKLQEQQRVETAAARAATNDVAAAEIILNQMKQQMEQDGRLTAMPKVAAKRPDGGWLGKIKGMFS